MSENTSGGDTNNNITTIGQSMTPRRTRARGGQAEDTEVMKVALGDEVYAINEAGYPAAGAAYLPHLAHIVNGRTTCSDSRLATLLNNYAVLVEKQGDYAAARPLYERALAIYEKELGEKHPLVATGLNNLAALLKAVGDYAAARPLYERALAIREEALGPMHPDTAQSLNNLALLLKSQGDYAAARPLYERALTIREQTPRPMHPDTATT